MYARMGAVISIMEALLMILFSTKTPHYMPFVACRIVELSITNGFCTDTAFGLNAYATSALAFLNDVEEACRWGKIALNLHESSAGSELKHPKLIFSAYATVLVLSEPIQSTTSILRDNHEKALAMGDPELACFSANCSIGFGVMFCGDNLVEKEQECNVVAK
ncbi:hypothetical protein ACHAWO_004670 [Cyclotella atomus]|uniref:Uncharacterized protein n=1 Tax=Cyclotella atomus TaxID=382360 RepID=A0ABD3QHW1_9STRA